METENYDYICLCVNLTYFYHFYEQQKGSSKFLFVVAKGHSAELIASQLGLEVLVVDADNTATALATHSAVKQAIQSSPNAKVLPTRTLKPELVADFADRFVANDYLFRDSYENKVNFRKHFNDLNFPEFEFVEPEKIEFANLSQKLGTPFVIQSAASAGSRGTAFVNSEAELNQAVSGFNDLDINNQPLVASKYVDGDQVGVQCFIGANGVERVSKLHRELVFIPELSHPTAQNVSHYGGAEFGVPYEQDVFQQIETVVNGVGSDLHAKGYRGILSIDFVVDESNKVFLIEVNTRISGMSPLISGLQVAVGEQPYLARHFNELLGQATKATNPADLPQMSYMILSNVKDQPMILSDDLKAGVYKQDGEALTYVRPGLFADSLKQPGEVLLQPAAIPNHEIAVGSRGCYVTIPGLVRDDQGKLTDATWHLIANIHRQFAQS